MTISLFAGAIALAVVVWQFTSYDEWELVNAAAGPLMPLTADEGWKMSGVYERYQPEDIKQVELIVVGKEGSNESELRAEISGFAAAVTLGDVVWGTGRTLLDEIPCNLFVVRKGWEELVLKDNGYCDQAGNNLSGRYRRVESGS